MRPDAIGLNFYAGTPRVVSPEVAAEIVRRLPPGVEPVGVFVNHRIDEMLSLCWRCGIKTVQLHGDETPAHAAELQRRNESLDIIRVLRPGRDAIAALADDLAKCREAGVRTFACLLDARVDGLFGGTGRTAPWDALAARRRGTGWPPPVLAGGLRPDNVATAIASVEPWGVDVAGGVESAPAVKDLSLVSAFIRAAREADRPREFEWADGI
jgi:phosphoribosylanthranilate isomerase